MSLVLKREGKRRISKEANKRLLTAKTEKERRKG